ncbi:N-acetylated-alpha-linked acidic dipeptidase 2 [Phytophthora nicotianae]|uniref:N-acetylated-alpha-linked acidic dipeptidase 2 n=1 Tax=Phytophthora nicotianae TaxID=4792 RepID=A0A0W8DMW2_PHYNI|nr:N-acetylated-alpha-linked acidic dipeptidase 2 [Phytophthora nicotianae]
MVPEWAGNEAASKTRKVRGSKPRRKRKLSEGALEEQRLENEARQQASQLLAPPKTKADKRKEKRARRRSRTESMGSEATSQQSEDSEADSDSEVEEDDDEAIKKADRKNTVAAEQEEVQMLRRQLGIRNKERANELYHELLYDGVNIGAVHADRTKEQRDDVIRRFRTGEVWVLICTDLMSRGMDFKAVNMVINYDFPQVKDVSKRKELLKAPPTRHRINTVSGYDLQKANRLKQMKQAKHKKDGESNNNSESEPAGDEKNNSGKKKRKKHKKNPKSE